METSAKNEHFKIMSKSVSEDFEDIDSEEEWVVEVKVKSTSEEIRGTESERPGNSAEKVSRENLVEVARIVRKWLDESPETNTADVVRGKTDRDLDILCSSLEMVAASCKTGSSFWVISSPTSWWRSVCSPPFS